MLPRELETLANLRCLKLDHMDYLNMIPRRLISSFAKSRVFRMSHCSEVFLLIEDDVLSGCGENLAEELFCLQNLNALSIQLDGSCNVRKFLKSQKLQSCTQCLHLVNLEESLAVLVLIGMKHLDQLSIHNSGLEELKIDYCPGEILNMRESHSFSSLRKVSLTHSRKLRDATWLVFAPNPRKVLIFNCQDMVEVISVEKCGQVSEEVESLNPFAKLESFQLLSLSCLKSIYWKPLPFPHLKMFRAFDCPMLEKLPLDFNRVKEGKIVIEGDAHLWEEMEREHTAA